MNELICFYCKTKIEYDGEKYRDINCGWCGIMNSIYDPEKIIVDKNEKSDILIDNGDKT
jgi:hypothetical protein